MEDNMSLDSPLPPLDANQRYTYEESIAYLRESRRKFFMDVKEGKIKVIEDGRRRYVPGYELIRRSRGEE